MIKRLLFCLLIIPFFVVSSIAADEVLLYADVTSDSPPVQLLIDYMRTRPDYDPYNQYAVCCVGDGIYRLYYGRDISQQCTTVQYMPASLDNRLTLSDVSGVYISDNNYLFVGNVEGAVASDRADQYGHNYTVGIICIFIAVVFLFSVFRRQRSSGDRYYRVR